MIGMEWMAMATTALAVVAVTGAAVIGIAAITTGWVPPVGWKKVLRPKLWGYGSLTAAVGMGAFLSLGPLSSRPAAHFNIALVGMAVFFLGTFLQYLSQRPARTDSLNRPQDGT
ncbi:hypothetical protein ACFY3J_06475 [Streptomyces sp. NPDC001231]|uniref:hypothetical protein n=1 Tax=Streptomyces sp. NPDC001231 TaxID=3364549 RepID=UPI0036904757